MSKDIKKALEHCVEWNCDNCPNGDELGSGETVCRGRLLTDVLEYLADLEAELAESKRNNLILYSMLYETLEKQGCEDIASQIDQMTGCSYEKEADWFKGNKNYDQLKQQVNDWKQRFESSEERNKQMTDNSVKALELKNEKIKELKQQLITTEKALDYAIFELDFARNHIQSTNAETFKRIDKLRNKILNKAKEMLENE